MDQNVALIAAVVVVIAVLAIAWLMWRQRSSRRLRERFGTEYHREVDRAGSVRAAEAELEQRERRVAGFHIRPLAPEDAVLFAGQWKAIQARFVDDPNGAVTEADRVIGEVMLARGYPVGDFEQQVADISVDHPDVVMNYRAARDIAEEHAHGRASTEDLRQAMVHYRALFRDLLETPAEASRDADRIHARRA
jgi:hypothetical protein